MFTHIHYVRLIFLSEDAPEFAESLPAAEWINEANADKIALELDRSAAAVRQTVLNRFTTGQAMNRHYDHPILYIQHMIWHEEYHHGQIKLALKLTGRPFEDKAIGPGTWGTWMSKTKTT